MKRSRQYYPFSLGLPFLAGSHLGRLNPSLDAKNILSKELITIIKIYLRKLPPKLSGKTILTIEDAVAMISTLGGFLSRKGDGPPGMTSIWRG